MKPIVQGIGLGLRMPLAKELLATAPTEVKWLEIHPENYLRRGGKFESMLEQCGEYWPIVTHGLTMSFGSAERFDEHYLRELRNFLATTHTPWHSDHLCFGGSEGVFIHDLLPLPFTIESVHTCRERYRQAQDALELPLAVENLSYYAHARDGHHDEAGFILDVLDACDGKMLLDVNNVYVNSKNHGFDPRRWIDRIPPERVLQIHVAGHFVRQDGLRIDTHAEDVCNDVYDLLEYTLRRMGPKPVLLERDDRFPALKDLLIQVRRLNEIYERAVRDSTSQPSITL